VTAIADPLPKGDFCSSAGVPANFEPVADYSKYPETSSTKSVVPDDIPQNTEI